MHTITDWPAIRHTPPLLNAQTLAALQAGSAAVALAATPRLYLDNRYYRDGHAGTRPQIYLRAAVAQQLQAALQLLPANLGLWLFDGWRSRDTQAALFSQIHAGLCAQHPAWGEAQLLAETRKFVAHPHDAGRFPVMPHLSGGAVDVAIFRLDSGELLDFGTAFDATEAASQTDYFEQDAGTDSRFSHARWLQVRQHRRLLFGVMQVAGFSNYHEEWWHYDLGDCLWAEACGSNWYYPAMSPDSDR